MFFYVFLIVYVLLVLGVLNILKSFHYAGYTFGIRRIFELSLIFLFIFRYDVGWDYPNYYNSVLQPEGPSDRLEPFSYIFFSIANYIKSPGLLFILYGLPTYLLIFSILKKYSCNYEFSFLIYLCLFVFDSFGLIRQALAVAITFYGYRYIVKHSFFKYLLVVGIATCFHYSAIVSILIYPLFYLKTSFFLLILFCTFILKEFMFQLIIADGTYAIYLKVEELMSGGNKIFLFYYGMGIFLLLFATYFKNFSLNRGLFHIFFFAFFFPLIFGNGIAIRIVSYYVIYLVLLIPLIFKSYPFMRIFVGCFCLTYFFVMLWISSGNSIKSPYTPYKNIIFNNNEPFK